MTDAAAAVQTRSVGVRVAPGVDLHTMVWEPAVDRVVDPPQPDVLCVHGLASNAQLWTGLAVELATAGHRVVAVDQRGHGLSAKVDDAFDFGTLTDDLLAVVDAHGLDRPVAVGQSWGGNVVLELGARHADRVRGVVAVDGGHIELADAFDDEQEMLRILRPPPLAGMRLEEIEASMRERMAGWPEAGVQGQLANFVRHPDGTVAPHLTLERHLAILREMWRHRPSTIFADVDVPVLLLPVRGGPPGGGATKESAVEVARKRLPAGRVVWLEGSHDIHAQDPSLVAAVLREALDEHFFDGRTDEMTKAAR